MARPVVPGHPHHVTQRGVRRMEVFLVRGDYETYLGLLREWCADIWGQYIDSVTHIASPVSRNFA